MRRAAAIGAYAHLTPSGRAKMEAAAPDHVDSVRRHFIEPLGVRGVQQLGTLFQKVREHLHQPQPA